MQNILIVFSRTYGAHIIRFDEEDSGRVLARRWCISKGRNTYYARDVANGKQTMHRILTRTTRAASPAIDHINGNGLDNRRSNLRQCTATENGRNSRKRSGSQSAFKGVSVYLEGKRISYRMEIKINGTRIRKRTRTAIEAALLYDMLACEHFGAFAATNKSLGLL